MRKDVLITGKNGFIGKRIKGGRAFKGRISRLNILAQADGIKGIVHLAALSNKRSCDNDPGKCIDSNLRVLCDILEAALFKGMWVLFISTYQIKERNLYGLSKLFGEELCRLYQNKGLGVSILRLPIVYGPNDKSDKVVTKFINILKEGNAPKINTKENFYFTYIDDIVKRIESEVDFSSGRLGKKHSLIDLTEGIQRCLKRRNK